VWLSVGARAISLLGDEAAVVALTLRLHDSGGSAGTIAALFVAGALPLVLFAPLAGRMVDRYDSRHLLVWSAVAQAAGCAALAGVHAVPSVLALVAALGIGQAINGATWQALLPRLVGDEQLPAAMSVSQSARTVAGIAAPAIGGVLTGRYGAAVPLLLDAGTFVVIAVAGLLVRTRRHIGGRAEAESGRGRVLRDDPVLIVLLSLLTGFIVLGAMVNVVDVFLVRDTLHASATWYGVVAAVWGGGMLLGSVVSRRWQRQDALVRLVLVSTTALSISLLGYALAPSVGWIVPVAVAGGAANGLLNYSVSTLTMLRSADAVRGRVAAAISGITSAGMIGAFFLGGIVATFATPRQIFLASGVLGVLAPIASGRRLMRAAASLGDSASRMLCACPTHPLSSAAESAGSTERATPR
jgi:MFS family permease